MSGELRAQTRVERLLTLTGYTGFGFGLIVTVFSIVVLIGRRTGLGFYGPTAFSFGASTIVVGLIIVGLAQALASLRMIAENETSQRGSE